MRVRVHHSLFAGFLGVVGLLVVLIVVLVGSRLRTELVRLYREELRRELELAAVLVAELDTLDGDGLADLVGRRTGYRVTLIAADGRVLGDSDVARGRLPEVESHRDRPEVRDALSGDVGFAERESATVGTRLLYGAQAARWRGEPVVLRIAAPLDEVEAAVGRAQGAVAGAGVLAMLLALGVAYLLSRAFSRPLVNLAERAAALSAGDFSRRAPRHVRVKELDELSQAFNRLSDELAARLAELGRERDEMQALIDCMAEGVVALTGDARLLRMNRTARALLELGGEPTPFAPIGTLVRHPDLRGLLEEAVLRPFRAREIGMGRRSVIVSARPMDLGGAVVTLLDITELRRMEQVRRDFVANASHELKTPLTAVRGFAETLLDDEPPEEIRQEFLASIRDNTLRMQRLVDDLLDLSRLESGGWIARPEEVLVAEVAREAWSAFRPEAEEREIVFEARGEAVALADPNGLAQVFQNLLENALRHTPVEGRVWVEIETAGSDVRIAVRDTGSGIPAAALPRIFERFFRVDPARSRGAGGTGLGLAIVRHLVLAMGGEVGAESQVGKGTTIRLTLPRAPSDEHGVATPVAGAEGEAPGDGPAED